MAENIFPKILLEIVFPHTSRGLKHHGKVSGLSSCFLLKKPIIIYFMVLKFSTGPRLVIFCNLVCEVFSCSENPQSSFKGFEVFNRYDAACKNRQLLTDHFLSYDLYEIVTVLISGPQLRGEVSGARLLIAQ